MSLRWAGKECSFKGMDSPAQPDSRCGRIGWAVIRTHPQAESRAVRAIELRGYQTYLPSCVVGREKPHAAPLFPRYAFVAIGQQPWTPVRYAPGVDQLLMNGMRPAFVPDEAVEVLQAGEGVRLVVPPVGAHWRPGDACKVNELEGVVHAINGDRAHIGVVMFGELRNIDVEVQRLRVREL